MNTEVQLSKFSWKSQRSKQQMRLVKITIIVVTSCMPLEHLLYIVPDTNLDSNLPVLEDSDETRVDFKAEQKQTLQFIVKE